MDFDEETGLFTTICRCGGRFGIVEDGKYIIYLHFFVFILIQK